MRAVPENRSPAQGHTEALEQGVEVDVVLVPEMPQANVAAHRIDFSYSMPKLADTWRDIFAAQNGRPSEAGSFALDWTPSRKRCHDRSLRLQTDFATLGR